MMKSQHLPQMKMPLQLLLMAALLLGHPLPLQAGEPKVLLVRPEKIETMRGPKTASQPLTRDPFNWSREQISFFKSQEPREKSNSIGGLTLSGIIWDKTNPQAVINDHLVTRGETVGDSVIKQILKDLVVFEQNGVSHELWLESSPRPLPMKDKKH
jgi:type II secretory pathway component PulC